jgi:tagatose 1,6-diphosphate aldolase
LEFEKLAKHPGSRVLSRYYRMIDSAGEHVGNINLRLESTQHVIRIAGHVGYGVHAAHRGHRYAAQAVRLIVPVAREHGIDPLWITCDPENIASRRTLELAGAEYVETVPILLRNAIFPAGNPRKCRFRLSTADQSKEQEVPSELP